MAESAPYTLEPSRVAVLQPLLDALLQSCLRWRPDA